ncbi:hypothetical protein Ccrd_021374 [Cynara cardunculus var. scolymus]|uniref:Uncharacterized protein n=1 Tax=Cynara cardunculus var. scolymus TaxID=59895 RepID=A0A103Y0S1_CYNCS|nr:hypothetical protein Ccrd_021374 [Cynara cardunculus var. scolymus]
MTRKRTEEDGYEPSADEDDDDNDNGKRSESERVVKKRKREAPEYWCNLDPYWKGTEPLMHRYFHPDGSQTADSDDEVWGGHESCYSIVTSLLADGKIREHYVRINRWPQMYVSRRQDWGWEMSNWIYCYSSVRDADKKGGTGPYLPTL